MFILKEFVFWFFGHWWAYYHRVTYTVSKWQPINFKVEPWDSMNLPTFEFIRCLSSKPSPSLNRFFQTCTTPRVCPPLICQSLRRWVLTTSHHLPYLMLVSILVSGATELGKAVAGKAWKSVRLHVWKGAIPFHGEVDWRGGTVLWSVFQGMVREVASPSWLGHNPRGRREERHS